MHTFGSIELSWLQKDQVPLNHVKGWYIEQFSLQIMSACNLSENIFIQCVHVCKYIFICHLILFVRLCNLRLSLLAKAVWERETKYNY